MTTDFIYFREILLDRVASKLSLYGFSRRSNSQEFSKKTAFGRNGFHLTVIKHKGDFDLSADVAIRFDELEGLVNNNKKFLSSKQKKETYSLGVDIGNITGEGDNLWTIVALPDIEPVSESLLSAFRTVALPYFEAYSDIETALQILSRDDQEAMLHSPVHTERAMRAIGLAYILGDRKRFSAISAAKTKFLISRKDPMVQSFLQLRDNLDNCFQIKRLGPAAIR